MCEGRSTDGVMDDAKKCVMNGATDGAMDDATKCVMDGPQMV